MKFGSAVILAGGRSRRMGFDKQLLSIDGKRIIQNTIDCLKEEFSQVIVISSKPYFYDNVDVEVYSDEIKFNSPLAGIYTGLLRAKSEYVYITACDMPFVDREWIKILKKEAENRRYEICCGINNNQIMPFNAFYSKNLKPKILNSLKKGKSPLDEFIVYGKNRLIETDDIYKYQFLKLDTKQAFAEYAHQRRNKSSTQFYKEFNTEFRYNL